ncbi:MAG: antibiotic biosynthesis monooxygenase [Actinomycetales bacterium]|nr:MAG: antibiotic biosynthesis monooxygenase [Actinomycetales bacterium]
MSIVKINVMQIAEGQDGEFLQRFSTRPHRIEQMDGFEGFQVLRPNDERRTWLVVTQWRDDAAYENWYAGRPQRDPATITYADSWELWSFDVMETATPVESQEPAQ